MFGWKRRRDGFEWREYVRTTILLKRKKRADRVSAARDAAVEGLKAAAERGAAAGSSGARAAGAGIRRAASGLGGSAMSGAGRAAHLAGQGAKAAASAMRAGSSASWRGLRHGLGAAGNGIGAAAAHLKAGELPRVRMPKLSVSDWRFEARSFASAPTARSAATAAGWALAGAGVARAVLQTVDVWALGLAAGGLALALIGQFGFGVAAQRLRAARQAVGERLQQVDPAAYVPTRGALRTGTAAVLAAVAGAGSYALLAPGQAAFNSAADYRSVVRRAEAPRETGSTSIVPLPEQKANASDWFSLPEMPSLAALNPFAEEARVVSGRARVVAGDTLVIDGETLKLEGIEAPEVGQTCSRPGARRWRCGVAAERELEHLVRRTNVTCEVGGRTLTGARRARCRAGERDLAETLVSSGHVFAAEGYFATYASQEADARARKAGIWRGRPVRPDAFRQEQWTRAVKSAPGGCPIKGRDDQRRGKVYVVPWSVSYERFNVREGNGDRWFCSETEAIEAGWRPFERS